MKQYLDSGTPVVTTMVERTLSPDGKSEWTGSEWVPVGTDVQRTSGANVFTHQKIVDSVIMGDLTSQTIVQNLSLIHI